MKGNVTQQLIEAHLVDGKMTPGEEIGLRIDQTLTQDATGTMVMLEFEAMQVPWAKTEVSAQYIDHNLLQTDFKNADDHLFLLSACKKFGVWYSRPGNGVSHPVHMERFGKPGRTLLGSDSHTPAAGSLGMLAMGAGGLEVALAMAGEPVYLRMPSVLGVQLTGRLPDWVSAKDVILEMLRRRGVQGGVSKIIEYYGPGLECLSAMDRHVIANMGTELGATTTVFPSDDEIMPAGSRVLPYRSNIPEISRFVFAPVDESFHERAMAHQRQAFYLVGGNNYGQGSSREHAALAPRYLGLKAVIAKSFARIHRQNLVNFGILPLTFRDPDDYDRIRQGDVLEFEHAVEGLRRGQPITVRNATRNTAFVAEHGLSVRQIAAVLEGGLINVVRKHRSAR
jgi:aconitase A